MISSVATRLHPNHDWRAPDKVTLEEERSVDTEVTRLTASAHNWAMDLARAQFGKEFESEVLGASLRLLLPAEGDRSLYLAEVRGQESFTAHGKTGTHPDRLAALADLGLPVLLVFVERRRVDYVWLHLAPPRRTISNALAHLRDGWFVSEMENATRETFRFPRVVPPQAGRGCMTIRQQLFDT